MILINSCLNKIQEKSRRVGRDDEPDSGTTATFCLEVMKAIVKAVSESADPTVQQSLSELCERMDKEAQMTEETIEEMLFYPIGRRRDQRKGPFTAQAEEDLLD